MDLDKKGIPKLPYGYRWEISRSADAVYIRLAKWEFNNWLTYGSRYVTVELEDDAEEIHREVKAVTLMLATGLNEDLTKLAEERRLANIEREKTQKKASLVQSYMDEYWSDMERYMHP